MVSSYAQIRVSMPNNIVRVGAFLLKLLPAGCYPRRNRYTAFRIAEPVQAGGLGAPGAGAGGLGASGAVAGGLVP